MRKNCLHQFYLGLINLVLLWHQYLNIQDIKSRYSKLREKSISRVHISVTNYMSMKRNKVTNMKDLHREKKKPMTIYRTQNHNLEENLLQHHAKSAPT